jgi:hypothetical protein
MWIFWTLLRIGRVLSADCASFQRVFVPLRLSIAPHTDLRFEPTWF